MRSLRLALAAAVVTSLVAGCMAASVALDPTPVTLATGTPGGIYHPVGNAICRMFNLEREQARPCVAVRSDGAVANIQRVERDDATFGLAQTDLAYSAYRGEGPFAAAGPDSRLRTLIALYPEAFTVVARADSGIRDFADLRGRRIGIGMSGAGYTFTRDVLLEYYGGWTISPSDRILELGPAEQNRALCENKVDAIIFRAGHPDGLTQEATMDCPARLVRVAGPPIDRLLAALPYYIASFIPGGMYRGNPDDVPTFGTQAVLVTSSAQPDQLAYDVVKAVFENFADFRRLHPVLSILDRRLMVPNEAVMPIHPGALKYFREAGLVP